MSESRARRSTTKRIDYAKEQEFSDEDLFEDEEAPVVQTSQAEAPVRKRKARKPKDNSTTNNAGFSGAKRPLLEDTSSIYQTSRVVYTEKGYDPALPPIRERFTFMPEYEEDGTMKIELIVGRRPLDESIHDKNALGDDSDEESDSGKRNDNEQRQTQDSAVSEKSLSPGKANKPSESTMSSVVEYEYLIKYKGRSYLHLEWKTGADLESMNKSAKTLYRRYLKKLEQGIEDDLENPEFDPSYVIPERILDEAEQEMTIELTDKELLRWEKQRERELSIERRTEYEDELNMSLEENTIPDVGSSVNCEKKEGRKF
jgi:hypothetical protein